jgi:hypothetical protein
MPLNRFLLLLLLLTALSPQTAQGESRKKIYNLCTINYPSDSAIPWDCRKLKNGETAEKLFGDLWQDLLRFNRIDRRHFVPGVSIKLPRNPVVIAGFSPLPASYPEAAEEDKFILVDLSEQFLAAYEFGEKVFSFPIASGNRKNPTPTGDFRVSAFNRRHKSSLYQVEKTTLPYPMHYALRFYINKEEVAFWLHGRDLPGFPASHGCIGLYDEEMQKKFYNSPRNPQLQDSRTLYEWAIDDSDDNGGVTMLKNGPKVRITGKSPL